MNRVALGALCAMACFLSMVRARHMRGSLGGFALEQIEHVFDLMEKRMRGAA